MPKPRGRRIAYAFLVALLFAGGFATARLVAQIPAECLPLGCFEPGDEGEIWQSLAPWGEVNDPSCTNSTDPLDQSFPLIAPRQCEDPTQPGRMIPPPPGRFMYPYALAVDGERVYVSDQFNHRVQVFEFDGTPILLAHPIGDGTPGDGQYSYTDGAGLHTGQQLQAPEGLAVDASHRLLVADSYNGRVAVFNQDGTPAFGTEANPQHLTVIDTVSGGLTTPTGVALSPGLTLLDANPNPDHRIVVTDRLSCFVYIYDTGFNLLAQLPSEIPVNAGPAACTYSEPGNPAPLGTFGAASGAAIDSAGHIYIADYDNSRIQILDRDGNVLGSFGEPPDASALPPNTPPPVSAFAYPWAVIVDHRGRLAVTDTENQRIAFFKPDFTTTPPTVTYLFALNAGGTLDGYPTGLAEQVSQNGGVDGLDPAGRILATDTGHHRVQRFQLPDLAIINAEVSASTASGSFSVVVPDEKANGVSGVSVTIATDDGTVSVPVAVPPANPLLPNDILPGQIVNYTFTFVSSAPVVTFTINASGNAGNTDAEPVVLTAYNACIDCVSSAEIFESPLPSAPTPPVTATLTDGWYNTPLVIRITATSSQELGSIAYQFTSGPESGAGAYGLGVHLEPVSGTTASIDVLVARENTSVMKFWAVNADGTTEQPQHSLTLPLDLTPPSVNFTFPPATNGWYNGDVSVTYTVSDGLSGSDDSGGHTLPVFINEGRDQFQTVAVADRAGNEDTVQSDDPTAGGRGVNIDRTPPQIQTPAAITIELTAPGVGVIPIGSPQAAAFVATASDPVLADTSASAGSGVLTITNPVVGTTQFVMEGAGPTTSAWTFTATDRAGNSSSATANVTVSDTTGPLLACPAPIQVALSGDAGVVTVAIPNVTGAATTSDLSGTAVLSQAPAAGSGTMGLGSHSVTVTSQDGSGNVSMCLATVNVVDLTPPALDPDDVSAEATGATGAMVTFAPTATDNAGAATVSCVPASGSTFALGNTTVTCTATDGAGNTSQAPFTVTVVDTTPPVIPALSNLSAEGMSPAGAAVAYVVPAAVDAVSGNVALNCVEASGSTFPLGPTTVTCTATDARGNSSTRTFTVTVADTTPPALTLPVLGNKEATGPAGAAVVFASSATDLVDLAVTITCDPASGSTFPLGSTVVECTATDDFGNRTIDSFTINVVDTTPPVITVPAVDLIVEATGVLTQVDYVVTAIDAVDGATTVDCVQPSGSLFSPAPATVVCTSTDSRGNTSEKTFTIKVQDTLPPVLDLPDDITVEATGAAGAVVAFIATANDAADGALAVTCAPPTGSTFPIGTTTVECSATDRRGHTATGSFTVTVLNHPPTVAPPANITTLATSSAGAAVAFTATGADLEDGALTPTCVPASGSTFPLGTTTVTCTVTDSHGKSAQGSFTVTVQNNAPTFTPPANITTLATSSAGAAVAFTATGSDVEDVAIDALCVPASGATFPIGTTTVFCTVTDSRGATAEGSFTVTVQNNAPTFTPPANISKPATTTNSAVVTFTATGHDVEDGSVPAVCVPASGSTFPLGVTTVNCTVTDSRGASVQGSFTVTVTAAVPPTANPDSHTMTSGQTLTIAAPGVLANDASVDGRPLAAVLVADASSGNLTLNSNGSFTFTPTTGFTGTVTFTYRAKDTVTTALSNVATVTITVQAQGGKFRTQTQGGWGSTPSGGNPGAFLHAKFAQVYPGGSVLIGGGYTLRFTNPMAITVFLPQGGKPGVLKANAVNPTNSNAGVFAGQVLALRLSVDFSNAGVTKSGLGALKVKSGKLAGYTVNQVLALANAVLGGTTSALPPGVSMSDLNNVVDAINNNFVDGTANLGYLQ